MPATRRTTVYLERKLYRALKARATRTRRRLSTIVNETLADILLDEQDVKDSRERMKEKGRDFEQFVSELKRNGRL